MNLRDPVAAYLPATNLEAHVVCRLLEDAGIEAAVTEDNSLVGVWMGGTVPGLHKPKVWIDRSDVERAAPLLEEYDRRLAERRLAERERLHSEPPIEVLCEACGERSEFPAVHKGTVQDCPHCDAYVDVGDVEIEGWDEVPPEDEEEPPV